MNPSYKFGRRVVQKLSWYLLVELLLPVDVLVVTAVSTDGCDLYILLSLHSQVYKKLLIYFYLDFFSKKSDFFKKNYIVTPEFFFC